MAAEAQQVSGAACQDDWEVLDTTNKPAIMNETQLPLMLTVTTGLLLVWRVTVMTGFLPLGATLRLYRESFGVLRRHQWILLVFLTGAGAALLVTETQRVLVTRAHWQQMAAGIQARHDLEISWKAVLQNVWRRSWSATSAWVWAEPCRGLGIWLAVVALSVFRRRIIPQVLAANQLAPITVQRLNWLIWAGAGATVAWIVIQFGTAIGWDGFPKQRVFWVVWAVFLQVLSLLFSVFWVATGTYFACGLITAARQANSTDNARPALLLEVNFDGFCRLLKLCVFTTAITGVLPAILMWLRQFCRAVFLIGEPHWLQMFLNIFASLEQVFAILVFPAVLFIVLDQAEWRPALSRTVDLWRRHSGEWLALVLPVFVLAFVVNVLRRWMQFYTAPTVGAWPIIDVCAGAIGALASAWWLVTIVRWWDVTKTRAGQ